MIGLIFLFVVLLYTFLTIFLTKFAIKAARRRGIAGWKWGAPVALVMFFLVFWDWIPTVVVHEYYCDKYAGLTIYKTIDQLRQENRGTTEEFKENEFITEGKDVDGIINHKTIINKRFTYYGKIVPHYGPMHIRMFSGQIVDRKTGEILLKSIKFDTDVTAIGIAPGKLRSYKFWVDLDFCRGNREWFKKTRKYMEELKTPGE